MFTNNLIANPTVTLSSDELATAHTTRRQLGKADDVANNALVIVSRLAKANANNNVALSTKMSRQLVQFLNNNATWLLRADNSDQYGFGDQTSVVHYKDNGRFVRAK